MPKLTALAIALLTVISIVPKSQAMTATASPLPIAQPAGDLQAQLIIKIGGQSDRSYRGDDRRRDDYYRRLEQREAERRRREYYSQRRQDRGRYHRDRDEYRGDYRHEYRGDYRHDR